MSSVGDCYLVIIDLDLYFDEIAKSKTVVQFALHAAYPPIELGDLRVAYLSGRQSKVRSSQPAKVCLRDALGEAPRFTPRGEASQRGSTTGGVLGIVRADRGCAMRVIQ
jgi:hypothetical protein